MAKTEKPEAAPETVVVTIKSDGHTHAGNLCKPGDKITVGAHKVPWLVERGVILAPAK